MEQIGKYKILDKIGEGAMGEVYKAHDPVLNRFVAIKTVAPTLTADEQFRQRFHREAQSAAALSHRNIVTVFEFGEERGVTYMVMELLEGTDLRDLIHRRGVPRLEDKLSIVEQICDGLGYAHQKGVVHRDLKPPNIHVLPSGQVKIMDFGLARLGASDMTRSGTVMGTPNYMSPEQVRGEKVDARSDVFSVGALTYELLVGHKPFEADSLHSVLYQVLDHEPAPIRQWVPAMPIPVVQVVERALAKDPARRFRNAGEMREALRGARQAFAAGRAAAMALGAPDAETTLVVEDSPPTLIDGSAPTAPSLESAVKRERRPLVKGATALDPTRIELGRSELPVTTRPHRTLQELRAAGEEGSRAVWLGAGAVALAGLVVAGGFWLRARPAPKPTLPPAEIAREQVGILKETLIAGQIELTRTELANKEYERTVAQAQRVLDLDPGNAEARELMKEARGKLDELQAAAREARDAFGRGDAAAATEALQRVLAIDPRHPAAGELTAALNKHFRSQAEDARARAARARGKAEKGDIRANDGFQRAARLAAAGDDLLRKGQFAEATRQFLEAGDGFDRALREAEVAAAVAAAGAARRAARVGPSLAPPSQSPSHPPPRAPSLAASSAAPTLAPPSASAASAPALARAESAVRQVIADYARAIETKDIGLFKTLKPDLTSDEERRLQEAFKSIPSQQVEISIDAIELDGAKAMVHASRKDFINGKPLRPHQQTFRLVRKDGAWAIQSIGQ